MTPLPPATAERFPQRAAALGVLLLVLLQALASARGAAAQDVPRENTLETARTLGLGTGARASAMGTSAVAQNAANLGMAEMYHLESGVGIVPGGGWWMGGTVMDSVSSRVAAGMSVRGVFNQDLHDYSGIDGRMSLGLPLSPMFGIGVSGRYVRLRPDGQDDGMGDPGTKGFTMDVALRFSPFKILHLAGLGYNLIDRGTALVPRLMGGSASIAPMETLTIGGDVLVDMTTFERNAILAGGGIEYLAGGMLPLRVGYRFDSGRAVHAVTGSIGYVTQQMGIDFALRQDVAGERRDTQLLITVRYHVQ
jgi:hypothetical protein